MIAIFRIVNVIITIFVLIRMYFLLKRFHSIIPIVIVFDFVMVVPIILELFLGNPESPYQNFTLAMNDTETVIWFNVFILSAQLAFLLEIRHLSKLDRQLPLKKKTFQYGKLKFYSKSGVKYKNLLLLFSYSIPVIALIAIIFSPSPEYYLNLFNNVYMSVDFKIQSYDTIIMSKIVMGLLLSVGILKWYDNNDSYLNLSIRIIYIALIILLNHKRTLLMVAIGLCLVIDIVKGKTLKQLLLRYSIFVSFAAFYFVYYSYATGKITFNNNWYYVVNEYFFRAMHMKFVIYAVLHPASVHILDYPGQSILFDLFYFIPRTFWPNKPLPYISYYISGLLGYSSYNNVSWNMPTSYYPEFISNFGIFGIWLSILFTIWSSRFFDKRDVLCKILGTSLICLLEIYYYNNALKGLVIVIVILYIVETNKKNRNSNILNQV